jgi:hypothetical protein
MTHTTLLGTEHWAQLEFSLAELGDARRNKRLVQVAAALAQCPSGTLPQAFDGWGDLKAAYRLFSNPAVDYQKILAPHWERTRQACTEPGEYLLIEDTSDLDYSSHRSCQGLGRIGNDYGRGLLLHTMLAVRVRSWDLQHTPEVEVVGVAGQKCWARTTPAGRRKTEGWRQRLNRHRESERWGEALSQMPPRPSGVSWIYVADREADIYESFERCDLWQTDFIIRAHYDRILVGEGDSAFAAVGAAPVVGWMEVEVRARPERTARTAKLAVRAVSVTLKGVRRPGGERPPLAMNMVEAREIDPPAGEEPIHWVLFTSLPVERWVQARRIVARYAKRWVIEEFHKALKSGANVEKSELETAERLKSLLAVLVVVAVRLLNLKMLARSRPEEPVDVPAFGPEAVEILSARFGKPRGGWTHETLLVAVARLGGFLARRGDGHPGWITIWRGWQRLMTMVEGVLTLKEIMMREGGGCG